MKYKLYCKTVAESLAEYEYEIVVDIDELQMEKDLMGKREEYMLFGELDMLKYLEDFNDEAYQQVLDVAREYWKGENEEFDDVVLLDGYEQIFDGYEIDFTIYRGFLSKTYIVNVCFNIEQYSLKYFYGDMSCFGVQLEDMAVTQSLKDVLTVDNGKALMQCEGPVEESEEDLDSLCDDELKSFIENMKKDGQFEPFRYEHDKTKYVLTIKMNDAENTIEWEDTETVENPIIEELLKLEF